MQLKEQYEFERAANQIDREVRAGTIRTWSGVYLDPLWPTAATVRIDDIAHALSLLCRYTGHVDTFYSVGQHCLEVADYIRDRGGSPMCELLGLLHDAEEAYFGDMSSPLKKNYPDYKKHGARMREFIFDKYVPGWEKVPMYKDMIHEADQHMYQIERISQLLPLEEAEKLCQSKYNRSIIHAKEPKEVETSFLRRFADLGAQERLSLEGRGAVSPKSNSAGY